MASIDVQNINGEKVSTMELSDNVFGVPVNQSVMHEVVIMQLARRRAGSASVKHRSDVAGSTRKLFRQKGTGRARRGSIKSPLMKGGGSVFGPDPRDYSYKVPKKVRRLALKMALSAKLKDNELRVFDGINLDEIKTQKFKNIINKLDINNVLIVIDGMNEKLELSARNIPNLKVLKCEGLNVYDVLKYKHLAITEATVKIIEGRLLA